jgi:SpoIIAA-like
LEIFGTKHQSSKMKGSRIVIKLLMLIDLSEFKWEKMEAWLPDLKFGSEFRHEIQKMAIVGDMTREKWITHLAKPFYAHDAKFFHHADIDKAWAWLRE